MCYNPPIVDSMYGVRIPDKLQAAMTFALTMPVWPNPDVRVEVAATGEITFRAQEDLENYIKIRQVEEVRQLGLLLSDTVPVPGS